MHAFIFFAALVNWAHSVELVPGDGNTAAVASPVAAPWRLTIAEPSGPNHVPGALSFNLEDEQRSALACCSDSLAVLPDEEFLAMMRDNNPTSLLWELTPAGLLVNQSSGQQLVCDGNQLSMVHYDETQPDQLDEAKQWALYSRPAADQPLTKPIAMRYVGFLTKHLQGVEVGRRWLAAELCAAGDCALRHACGVLPVRA